MTTCAKCGCYIDQSKYHSYSGLNGVKIQICEDCLKKGWRNDK